MPSNAVVTVNSLELSPVQVTYNSVDLGGTLGNVVVTWEYTKAEIKTDQWGTHIADRAISGFNGTIVTQVAEIRNFDKLKEVFPTVRDTTVTTDRVLDFLNRVGTRDKDSTASLVLHRLADLSTDESQDVVFFKAVPSEATAVTFGPEEQAAMEITWNFYADPTEGQDRVRFFRIGKETVVVP